MGIEETNYSAIDILNIVDGAELVTIVREIYLVRMARRKCGGCVRFDR